MSNVYLTPALNDVSALLTSQGLPIQDLTPSLLQNFIASYDDHTLKVVGGLEFHGNVGLLRSVVTAKSFRGQGLAEGVVNHLEQTSRQRGIDRLYLITIDAEGYFERLGYSTIPRDIVPKLIQETEQFSGLCPATAAVMMKKL